MAAAILGGAVLLLVAGVLFLIYSALPRGANVVLAIAAVLTATATLVTALLYPL